MTHMTRSRIYPSKELALLLLKFTEKSPEPEKIVHRTTIQEIYKKIQQGENFEDLAKQFSDDKSLFAFIIKDSAFYFLSSNINFSLNGIKFGYYSYILF